MKCNSNALNDSEGEPERALLPLRKLVGMVKKSAVSHAKEFLYVF